MIIGPWIFFCVGHLCLKYFYINILTPKIHLLFNYYYNNNFSDSNSHWCRSWIRIRTTNPFCAISEEGFIVNTWILIAIMITWIRTTTTQTQYNGHPVPVGYRRPRCWRRWRWWRRPESDRYSAFDRSPTVDVGYHVIIVGNQNG